MSVHVWVSKWYLNADILLAVVRATAKEQKYFQFFFLYSGTTSRIKEDKKNLMKKKTRNEMEEQNNAKCLIKAL